MVDVSKCRDLVPPKYFESHKYLTEGPETRNVELPDGRIPLNLALARWMACERQLTVMPNCFFYDRRSENMDENYVRMALCKDFQSLKEGAA